MKTIMDAVNELRGDCRYFGGYGDYIWFFNGGYEDATFNGKQGHGISLRADRWSRVCHKAAFGILVYELSHAAWIKGASLAEYQAADKEVLKVENKTVEVDGMVYEIGKYYIFADSLDSAGVYDKLKNITLDDSYKFASSSGAAWKYCSIPTGETGTITPAPVKLVDGAPYELDYLAGKFAGIYSESDGVFYLSHNRSVNKGLCKVIARLVPEGANSPSK